MSASMPVRESARPLRRVVTICAAPLTWLERTRGRRRLALLALYAILATPIGLWIVRELGVRGLPDIGDPFDVAAFQAGRTIPRAENAWVGYQAAIALLGSSNGPHVRELKAAVGRGDWSHVGPELRARLERSRPALELFRTAADLPRARRLSEWNSVEQLALYAQLEAQRLAASGQMVEAWRWHRAVLRASRHVMMSGDLLARFEGHSLFQRESVVANAWASDPRVDGPLLRSVLDEVVAIDVLTPPFSDTLKVEYTSAKSLLDDRSEWLLHPQNQASDLSRWYLYLPFAQPLSRFVAHEPTRSRRVIRLLYANRLAYADRPISRQPAIVAPGIYDISTDPMPPPPAAASHLDAPTLAAWYQTATAAANLPPTWPGWTNPTSESLSRANLILGIAQELYRRDHAGALPSSNRDLVGAYLEKLPDGAGNDDEPPATVSEPKPKQ